MTARKYNHYLFGMCGLAGLLYGIDVGLIAAALPYIKVTCAFSEAQLASIVAAVLLGAIPGKFLAAFTCEKFGRLAAFRLMAIIFTIAVPLICFSNGNFLLMFSGRLLQGIGVALVGIASPLYMAECADAQNRGKGTGMIQLVLTIGLVVAALVGYAVTVFFGPAQSPDVTLAAKNQAWQAIFWFSIVPTVFLFAGTYGLKESPRWLFKKGRKDEARQSLLANNDAAGADRILADLEANAAAEFSANDGCGQAVRESLLQRKYVLPFLIAFAVMVLTQATGVNSVLNYSVVIFHKAGVSGSNANLADTAIKLMNFLATIVALALVDRRGRKFLLEIGTAGVVIGLAFVGGVFLGLENGWLEVGPVSGWLAVVGFLVFIFSYGVGPGVCVWLSASELLPLRIRATGMMICGIGNMTTSWLIAQAFLPWSKAFGESSVFVTLAVIAVGYFLVALLALPETKGKSLEEIERYFRKER